MNDKIVGHILVVDDQDNWRDALTDLLAQEGHTVETAACFEEGLSAISQDAFDLVILDVRLVDTDVFNVQGLELLRLVKAQEPTPKVVVLTGYPESIHDRVLEKHGADALVLKVPQGSRFDSKGFKEQVCELLQTTRTG